MSVTSTWFHRQYQITLTFLCLHVYTSCIYYLLCDLDSEALHWTTGVTLPLSSFYAHPNLISHENTQNSFLPMWLLYQPPQECLSPPLCSGPVSLSALLFFTDFSVRLLWLCTLVCEVISVVIFLRCYVNTLLCVHTHTHSLPACVHTYISCFNCSNLQPTTHVYVHVCICVFASVFTHTRYGLGGCNFISYPGSCTHLGMIHISTKYLHVRPFLTSHTLRYWVGSGRESCDE